MKSLPDKNCVPDEFESERLVLRSPRCGDGKAVNEAVLESFSELQRWMPWAQKQPSLEESEEHCRLSRARYLTREDLALFLFSKSDNRFIGASGLHRMDWSVRSFEIGYWCRKSETGKGYITEAVERIARFAFEQFQARRVEVLCDDLNERSSNIPERLGFQLEGILRNHCMSCSEEAPRNTRVYSVTKISELRSQ